MQGVAKEGRLTRNFDPTLKGYAVCSHSSNAKFVLGCAPGKRSKKLGLTQQFVSLQVFLHKGAKFSLELCVLDSSMTSRRLRFSNSFRDVVNSTLHVQLPLNVGRLVPAGEWCTLCFDMVDLVHSNFKGNSFRSCDGIVLNGVFKLRQIFTIRAPPLDSYRTVHERIVLKNAQAIPKVHNYPVALRDQPITLLIRAENIVATLLDMENQRVDTKSTPTRSEQPAFTVAFGSRVSTQQPPNRPSPSKSAKKDSSNKYRKANPATRRNKPTPQIKKTFKEAVPESEDMEEAVSRSEQLLQEVLENDDAIFGEEAKSESEDRNSDAGGLDFPFDEGHFEEVEAVISKLEATDENSVGDGGKKDSENEFDDVAVPETNEGYQQSEEGTVFSDPPTTIRSFEATKQENDTVNGKEAEVTTVQGSREKDSIVLSSDTNRSEEDTTKLCGDGDILFEAGDPVAEDSAVIPEDDEIRGLDQSLGESSDDDILKEIGGDKTEEDIMRRFNEKRAELEELEESLAADLALEEAERTESNKDAIGNTAAQRATEEEDEDKEEGDLELIYDPILACYFCPKTNKYYSMKAT